MRKERNLQINLTDQKFDRLRVLGVAGRSKHGDVLWQCQCTCGGSVQVTTNRLRTRHTRSCGCLLVEEISRPGRNAKVPNPVIVRSGEAWIVVSRKKIYFDAEDAKLIGLYRWKLSGKNGHVVMTDLYGGLPLAHLLLNPPPGMEVDHKDRDPSNNRRSNLRICTHQQNMYNCGPRKRNTSGYKGVNFCQGKWVAELHYQKKKIYLGRFNTPEEAALAWNAAARKYHGEYAYQNEVSP